jgi:hypothetical protein
MTPEEVWNHTHSYMAIHFKTSQNVMKKWVNTSKRMILVSQEEADFEPGQYSIPMGRENIQRKAI